MEPELELMSDEEYYTATNDMSVRLVEIGHGFTDRKNELFQEIMTILINGMNEFREISDISRDVYDLFFNKQLNAYMEGADYILTNYKDYIQKNKLDIKFADINDVMNYDNESKEMLIDSCILFTETVFMILDSVGIEQLETSRDVNAGVIAAIGVYYETSFILGLTDAKALNYICNHEGSVLPDTIKGILEAIFPHIS